MAHQESVNARQDNSMPHNYTTLQQPDTTRPPNMQSSYNEPLRSTVLFRSDLMCALLQQRSHLPSNFHFPMTSRLKVDDWLDPLDICGPGQLAPCWAWVSHQPAEFKIRRCYVRRLTTSGQYSYTTSTTPKLWVPSGE